MDQIVEPAVERYVDEHTTPPAPFMAALAQETRARLAVPQMLTGTVEGRLLEMLVFALEPRLVLEVGTYSGYSALAMAASLPEGGRVVTCEISQEHADFAQRHIEASPYADRVEVRRGPALETMDGLAGPFDLVFIDADKENYVNYYEAALPKLAERGLIVADNTLWSGRVIEGDQSESTRGIRAFNEHVRADERVVSVMLSVRDGITLIRRAYSQDGS
jgi:caffeoyl-CoA O-methyltransferase